MSTQEESNIVKLKEPDPRTRAGEIARERVGPLTAETIGRLQEKNKDLKAELTLLKAKVARTMVLAPSESVKTQGAATQNPVSSSLQAAYNWIDLQRQEIEHLLDDRKREAILARQEITQRESIIDDLSEALEHKISRAVIETLETLTQNLKFIEEERNRK